MWDDSDQEEPPLDDTQGGGSRRAREEPLDLPLGPGSSKVRIDPPAAEPLPSHRKPKAAPLFPEWEARRDAASRSEKDPGFEGNQGGPNTGRVSNAGGAGEPDLFRPQASLGPRFLAGFFDAAILVLITSIVALTIRLDGRFHLGMIPLIWIGAFSLELGLLSAVLALFLFGRTPGMALASIKAEESDGMPVRFARAIRRVLWGFGTLSLPGLSLLVAAIREDGLSLVDLLSGTVVRVSEDAVPPPAGMDQRAFGGAR